VPELPDPRTEYQRRLETRRAELAAHDHLHRTIGRVRVSVALVGVVMVWLTIIRQQWPLWSLLIPIAASAWLAVKHDRVLRARRTSERAAAWYERGLARLENRWMGQGEPGERLRDAAHPYADDLDIFGTGSLFEYLSTARTRMGEETLSAWLRGPAPVDVICARQGAVDELRPGLELRERLALIAEQVRSEVDAEALAAWGEGAPLAQSRLARAAPLLLACLGVAAAVVWAIWGQRDFFVAALGLDALYLYRQRRIFEGVVVGVEHAAHELAVLAQVLALLEAESFRSPLLVRLRATLDIEGQPPSRRIGRLNRLMELLDSRENWLVKLIGPVLMWVPQLAHAVENWRAHNGRALRAWLAAVGEMEALCSLANYAYEHPADPFPEFVPEAPCFNGEGLVHPFLPEERGVRNNVAIGGELRVLVVSGSNMSGKSTLLRTVGVNAVLAQAGAPVRARRLQLSILSVGASIRVVDSLQEGASRFYAEITRLRRIMDLAAGPAPVLFLIDEFLHGTNSHDRRIGAEAIVRELVKRGAIGLLTTHDLALAEIADALAPRGTNVHFQDQLEDGRMSFDYVMRPGTVRKSNALELMRSVGLEV